MFVASYSIIIIILFYNIIISGAFKSQTDDSRSLARIICSRKPTLGYCRNQFGLPIINDSKITTNKDTSNSDDSESTDQLETIAEQEGFILIDDKVPPKSIEDDVDRQNTNIDDLVDYNNENDQFDRFVPYDRSSNFGRFGFLVGSGGGGRSDGDFYYRGRWYGYGDEAVLDGYLDSDNKFHRPGYANGYGSSGGGGTMGMVQRQAAKSLLPA